MNEQEVIQVLVDNLALRMETMHADDEVFQEIVAQAVYKAVTRRGISWDDFLFKLV